MRPLTFSSIGISKQTAPVIAVVVAGLLSACAFLGPGGPRDFIVVADISQVPESDPVTLTEARIERDSVLFEAEFGGGCREHDFTLYVTRGAGSDVLLHVHHYANHDPCRALVSKTVGFSLRGLKRDLRMSGPAMLRSAPGIEPGFSLAY